MRGPQDPRQLEKNRQHFKKEQRRFVSMWLKKAKKSIDFEQSLGLIESQLTSFDVAETVDLVLALEHVMLERGRWDTLLSFVDKAWIHCQSTADWQSTVRISAALGRLHFRQGRTEEAMRILNEGALICGRIADPVERDTWLGTILYLGGAISRLHGDRNASSAGDDYDRSAQLCRDAIDAKRRAGDRHGLASAYFNLGAVQTERAELYQGQAAYVDLLQEALQSLEQSRSLFEETDDVEHGNRTLIRIARVHLELGESLEALQELSRLEIDKDRAPRTWVDRELIRARAFESLGRSSEALDAALEALARAERFSMDTEIRQLRLLIERVGSRS